MSFGKEILVKSINHWRKFCHCPSIVRGDQKTKTGEREGIVEL